MTLFTGEKVALTAVRSPEEAEIMARWTRDTELTRLLDTGAARPLSAQTIRDRYDEFKDELLPDLFLFMVRELAGARAGRLLGFAGLEEVNWRNGDAWVGIGLGERDVWGQGYGADALRLLLRYAFDELGLHRVSLSVFDYNPRARRAYERCGFVEEGRQRQRQNRAGRRWDLIFMGVRRGQWRMGDR